MKLPWTPAIERLADNVWTALRGIREQVAELMGARESAEASAENVAKVLQMAGQYTSDMEELRHEVKRLRVALAEGIEHEERRENRINATVRRSKKVLEDAGLSDPALDAEYLNLSSENGRGGGESELSTVPEDLEASAEDAPSSVPGVTVAELQRARGLRA